MADNTLYYGDTSTSCGAILLMSALRTKLDALAVAHVAWLSAPDV
jgi:hypothetical protein